MMNRILRMIIAMVLVVSTVIFTAGFAMNTTAGSGKESTYKSKDGWTVKYDRSLIKVNEAKDSTSFVYTGDNSGKNVLTISYKEGVLPEQALNALTKSWGNAKDITKSESYFPGTTDKWGYWRTLLSEDNSSGINRNAFAGQYNNGTLVFDYTTINSKNAANNSTVWQALMGIANSATYDAFAPQTMYAGIAGVYTMKGTELVNGKAVPVEYTVTLNDDHQGVIKLQGDEQYVMWGTNNLIQADNSYDYSTDGHTLNLNIDGNNLVFTK